MSEPDMNAIGRALEKAMVDNVEATRINWILANMDKVNAHLCIWEASETRPGPMQTRMREWIKEEIDTNPWTWKSRLWAEFGELAFRRGKLLKILYAEELQNVQGKCILDAMDKEDVRLLIRQEKAMQELEGILAKRLFKIFQEYESKKAKSNDQ
jgi:hypothetical protein